MPSIEPDLEFGCAREPIRIPGGIQPHGGLLVLDPATGAVLQASRNLGDLLGGQARAGMSVRDLPGGPGLAADIDAWDFAAEPTFMRSYAIGQRTFDVLAHETPQGVVVDIEPASAHAGLNPASQYPGMRSFFARIGQARDLVDLCAMAARHIRDLTGFNRVLVYRFDADWNGKVIAEDRDDVLPSYLDLHFPASDIPAQARDLYVLNRLRLIPDAVYRPEPIEPQLSPVDGRPLDLSLSALRSVSPVHLEYMRNMGTCSSMSVSLVVDGRLWGLLSCHSAAAHHVDIHVRAACDLIGQTMSLQIGARERAEAASQKMELKQIEVALLSRLAESRSVTMGLAANEELWLGLTSAQGAVAVFGDDMVRAGNTPDEDTIRGLVSWFFNQKADLVATDRLSSLYPEASAPAELASGFLAIAISQVNSSCLIWFRPEQVQTVTWGGEPRKEADPRDPGRLHPRKSFASWKELVRGRSLPWSDADVLGARDLRNAILNVVLRQAEERAQLTDELQRSNKELEAFSYSVSHDLRAPFRHIVGFSELLRDRNADLDDRSRHYLANIIDAAMSAGRLVDDLLSFSQLGRHSLSLAQVDLSKIVEEARRTLQPEQGERRVTWDVGRLPVAWGDHAMLRQAVLNLCSNALKYTRHRDDAVIAVRGETRDREIVLSVSDNGVGFDMAYVGKLFGVFQRLHRAEDFEGTGIGLALTKRIIERHGGWIKAEGALDKGATFTFGLPLRDKEPAT